MKPFPHFALRCLFFCSSLTPWKHGSNSDCDYSQFHLWLTHCLDMLYNRRVAKAAQEGLILLECRAIMLYKSKQSDIQVSIACSWGSCERLFLFCTMLSKSPGFSPCQQGLFEQTFITPLLFLHNVFFLLLLNIKTITINGSPIVHNVAATKNQFIFLLKAP